MPERRPFKRIRSATTRIGFGWAFVVFLTLAMTPSVVRTSDTLDDVLALHVKWLGGRQALERIRDLHWEGTVAAAGLEGPLDLTETRDGWRRREMHLGPITTTEVIGPSGAWSLNFSGQVEPLGAAVRETERQENVRVFGHHVLTRAAIDVQDLGTEDREGRRWRVVRFAFPNGDGFDEFIDPTDGSCTWIRERRDTALFWTRLADWRMVSGVRVPFEQRSIHEDNPRRNSTVRWSSVNANRGVARAAFARPTSQGGTVSIAGAAASTPRMQMELVQRRWVMMRGKVEGIHANLLLDTGAQNTVLSSAFAARAGVASAGALNVEGTNTSVQASFAPGIDIELGILTLSNVTAIVADLRSIDIGRPVDGILGKELFNATVVDIDYPESTITFHIPRSFHPGRAARSLRLLPAESGGKLVEASIEGLPPAPFVLDTGAGSAVTLFDAYAEEHRLLDNRLPRSDVMMGGVGGTVIVPIATLRTLTLAGFELRMVPAEFATAGQGAFGTRRIAGNLGAGVLGRFRVMLDYSRDRLYLLPGPGWDSTPFCKNRAGIQTRLRDGFLEVVFIASGSPAARGGWKIGDRITAIDHQPIGPGYPLTATEWSCRPAGSTIVLTDSSGVDRTLVLAEYY